MSKRDFVRPSHSPANDLIHHGDQRAALLCQPVLDPGRNDRKLLAVDEAALLEVFELAAENAWRDRLSESAEQQRLANLAVALRSFDQHPQDAQLVLSAGQLIEADERAELARLFPEILES